MMMTRLTMYYLASVLVLAGGAVQAQLSLPLEYNFETPDDGGFFGNSSFVQGDNWSISLEDDHSGSLPTGSNSFAKVVDNDGANSNEDYFNADGDRPIVSLSTSINIGCALQ